MLRPAMTVEALYRRLKSRHIDVLKEWAKIQNAIMMGDVFVKERYTNNIRNSIERWIASASGTIRALSWVIGQRTFMDALEPLWPEYIDRLQLPWYDKEIARPVGELPEDLAFEMHPSHKIRSEPHVSLILHHAVRIHAGIYRIAQFHPGKWHPMFFQRVMNNLLFYDAVIRALEWSLSRSDANFAFYAFEDEVIDQLTRALKGIAPLDSGILLARGSISEDHDPDKDFG